MHLTALERSVMERVLCGEHPGLAVLRAQLAVAEVEQRQMTGTGFFTKISLPSDVAPAAVRSSRIALGDVQAEIGGLQLGAGFVIFIVAGRLDTLEGFSYGEPWPEKVAGFTLRDGSDASRGLSELA